MNNSNSSSNTINHELISIVIAFILFFICLQVYCICADFLHDKINRRRNPELYIQLP